VKKTILAVVLLLMVSLVVIFTAYQTTDNEDFVYKEHLQDVVFELDGKKFTLDEMSYYIAMQEVAIEKQAEVYNSEDTKEYWNIYTNGDFIRHSSKETTFHTAVHDMLLYEEAKKENVELTKEEENYVKSKVSDLYYDLTNEGKKKAKITEEAMFLVAEKSAIAEKYQKALAKEKKRNFGAYDYNGKAYETMLKKHELVTNEKLWKKVVMGEVTLEHKLED